MADDVEAIVVVEIEEEFKMSEEVSWKDHFESFLQATQEERQRSEKRRDYRDLRQWTNEEVEKLQQRGQAPVVLDHYSKKVDAICGLEVQRRTDPKAMPQKPVYTEASEAITDALTYVEASSGFDDIGTDVFEEKIVEGYGGCITEVDTSGKEPRIEVNHIPWDRIYYDPFSRKKDFTDCRYMGITLWMDLDDAIALNPEKEDDIRNLLSSDHFDDTTFEDRPSDWVNIKRKRVRVNQEYYRSRDGWVEVFYSGQTEIIGPRPSPYLDEDKKPMNPIELQSDFIDRDNNRWGYMQRLVDVQDEINHRRSKALHMLSSKTVIAPRGTFGSDITREEVLQELRKGMTYLEPINPNGLVIDNQQDLGQSQLAFYQDALNAVNSVGINPELQGMTDGAISGRAFLARQQGGMIELARIFARHSEWKVRVYKQIWARIKQFWTEEKWVRVTDDERATRFIGLNVPVRRVELLIEQQAGMPIDQIRKQNPQAVDQFIQQEIARDPLMGEVVETRNNVVEMEMDIVIDEAPDSATMQQEQFDTLAQLAGTRADPQMFQALLKLSNMRNKDEVLEMFAQPQPDPAALQAQQAANAQAMQAQMAKIMADIENTQADTAKKQSEVILNDAKTKDELASAIERAAEASTKGLDIPE